MNSPDDKRSVIRGILTAWVLSLSFIGIGYKLFTHAAFIKLDIPLEIFAVTIFLPTLSLAMGIGYAARTRHFRQNIDGSRPEPGSHLDITLRYVTNTTEQLVIFALVSIIFLAVNAQAAKYLLPIMGLWFFIARLLFWIGYHKHPMHRAVGFASTFHPTLLLLLSCPFLILVK